jgi:hypothetical protein
VTPAWWLLVAVVDSQDKSDAAVSVLESPGVDVVTITATEKGYCHQPATGEIDAAHPDIVHDLAHPDEPRSLPGLIVRALERRMQSHGQPITFVSCDNIPSNGVILESVVRTVAAWRGADLVRWIAQNVAFPDHSGPHRPSGRAWTSLSRAHLRHRGGGQRTFPAVGGQDQRQTDPPGRSQARPSSTCDRLG